MSTFQQFIRERQYLANVSPATVAWYKNSLRWLPSESPTQEDLKVAVVRMREKGLKATGCNCAIRAINAYLHWAAAGSDRKCGPGCQHLRVAKVKEPELVLPTFSTSQIKSLVKWKPKQKSQRRLHLLILIFNRTPWNGNLAPGTYRNDQICSPPMPNWTNSVPYMLSCCQAHDNCYESHNCNATSWKPWGFPGVCKLWCNVKVTMCFATGGIL